MIAVLAAFCVGTFFGAAIYINLAQHPATMATGGEFAGHFFPPMYQRAARLQIALAIAGTGLGLLTWHSSAQIAWLIGALFLVSVVPVTLWLIKPINDQLLDPDKTLDAEAVTALLKRWNPLHWIRTVVSGVAFLCYLTALTAGA